MSTPIAPIRAALPSNPAHFHPRPPAPTLPYPTLPSAARPHIGIRPIPSPVQPRSPPSIILGILTNAAQYGRLYLHTSSQLNTSTERNV
jgi:hypothetical protein